MTPPDAHPPAAPDAPHVCTIVLDVDDLDAVAEFWRRLLGFAVLDFHAQGLVTEQRVLASRQTPGVRLHLRSSFPRPAHGSTLGSLREIAFAVADPAAVAKRVGVHAPTDADAVHLTDPNHYRIALVRRPAGSE